ncbi:S41 family peptidase [Pedobacter yonginense]|nr:S41 family peptidase [Pedobacter yonginense]
MVDRIKNNYPGYADKITALNRSGFQKKTDSLARIASHSNPYECLSLSREWLALFKDKHVNMWIDFDAISPDSIRQFFSKEEKTSWTQNKFKLYLKYEKKYLDPIEGVWSFGVYQVGVVRDRTKKNKEFLAFVLKADSSRWMPQQVKFRLLKKDNRYRTVFFRAGDHSINYPKLKYSSDTLDFDFFGKWVRGTLKPKEIVLGNSDLSPKFRIIDPETALFTFPSFESMAYINQVDSIVKQNKSILENTKHLIIDLRDNGGGSVYVYESLMPYIYTNPILTAGGMVLATPDNIKDGYSIKYPGVSDSIQKALDETLIELKKHEGELYDLYPVDTIKFESIAKNPERVSFLINKNTASAAELFLLQAKQSTKCKIFGTASAGMVDYLEVITSKLPCDFYTLVYPAGKSIYSINNPLDNTGIKPDVELSEKIENWVDYVKTYKEK